MISKIVGLLDEMTPEQGATETNLEGVTLFRADGNLPRMPLIYDHCFCFALQGSKAVHLGQKVLTYGPDQFLVVPTILPVEVEAFAASRGPLLAVTIAIDHQVVQELIDKMDNEIPRESVIVPKLGAYLEDLTDEMLEPLMRLVMSLRTKSEAGVLGKQIVREIFYRALCMNSGDVLSHAANADSNYARISSVLRDIHRNYSTPVNVKQLALKANMSIRAFHKHFKAATSHTPVQYLKRIRLEKARQLLLNRGCLASSAAHEVGYESPSQFSREFKRYFGYTPSEVSC